MGKGQYSNDLEQLQQKVCYGIFIGFPPSSGSFMQGSKSSSAILVVVGDNPVNSGTSMWLGVPHQIEITVMHVNNASLKNHSGIFQDQVVLNCSQSPSRQ